MFYFRVFEDGDSELYARDFTAAREGDPTGDDFVISLSRVHFNRIRNAKPGGVYIRVFHDRHDQDLGNGQIFDENLARVKPSELSRNPALMTITPDEFEAALAMRP